MNQFKDYEVVRLKEGVGAVPAGATGTVLQSYSQEYLIEFPDDDGIGTKALLTLHESQISAIESLGGGID